MNDDVVVVTGGGQGLGRAVALAFGSAGFKVAVLGRTAAKLEETCRLVGENSLAVAVDLTDPAAVRAAFSRIDTALGPVAKLVNNAASYTPFLIGEASDAELRSTVDGTLMSALYCIREAIPRMTERGEGDIITVTSESIRMPAPFLTLYAAAKAALSTLHEGLRNELRGSGIRPMIFETGRITESSVGEAWDPAQLQRFEKVFVEQGYAAMLAHAGVTPESLAATLLHMAAAPREATIEMLRIRSGV